MIPICVTIIRVRVEIDQQVFVVHDLMHNHLSMLCFMNKVRKETSLLSSKCAWTSPPSEFDGASTCHEENSGIGIFYKDEPHKYGAGPVIISTAIGL